MAVEAAPLVGQRPAVVWLTGRPGAGKSTIAGELWRELTTRGRHACVLDGDRVRDGLCRDLGFSPADRAENVRRIAEVARLMTDSGLIVIVSSISPFRDSRDAARELFDVGVFFEAYVDTPLEVAAARDPKGLYARAQQGKLPQFTGIDSPYEAPPSPEIHLRTDATTPQQCAAAVVEALINSGRLEP